MPGRRQARDRIGQEWPEAGARFDPRIPVLGRLVLFPGDIAEIIDRRQMGGGRDIGEGQILSGQPVTPFYEVVDIV